VGAVRGKGDVQDPVHVLLRTGREVFADTAAAMASLRVASEYEDKVKACLGKYSKHVFAFPVPPGVKELVEKCKQSACIGLSAGVPVRKLVAAGAPGAGLCARLCSKCMVGLYFAYTYGTPYDRIVLRLYFDDGQGKGAGLDVLGLSLSLSAYIVSGSRFGTTATGFLADIVSLKSLAGEMREEPGAPEAGTAQLLDLMAWLASRSRGEWSDTVSGTAAGLVATLSPVLAAAFHEVQRASRVQARGLDYPAMEVVKEVRDEALRVYSAIAEAAGAAGHGHLPIEVEDTSIKVEGVTVWRVLDKIEYSHKTVRPGSFERSASEGILNSATKNAAAVRAAAEILASLSEPG